jgi:aryl-alcohol dehydrogenase-like predicted oxidoreductase
VSEWEALEVRANATFEIGGDLPIHRMGFGAMRLVGLNVWGQPADLANPALLLTRARELGVDFIDTAEAYGPFVNEQQIHAALAPYPSDLVIATKCGLHRYWPPDAAYPQRAFIGSPAAIRSSTEGSLTRLGVERLDLQQLHRIDPEVPLEESIGALADLQQEGKIRHIGLSEVTVDELARAHRIVPIATVQNRYNVTDREHEPVLDYCEAHGIGFIPWAPIGGRSDGLAAEALQRISEELQAAPRQVALAWLLARSPAILLIPGTASVSHLEQNVAAGDIELSEQQIASLNAIARPISNNEDE